MRHSHTSGHGTARPGPGSTKRPSRMSLANAAKARLASVLGSRFNVETYAFSQELLPKPVSRRPEDVRRAGSPSPTA